jgi:predicted nucleic acid-binding protein
MILSHTIFIDTSAYYALVDRDDIFRSTATQFIKTNKIPFITSSLIIIETLNLVKQRLGYTHAIEIGKKLFDRAVTTVINTTDEDMTRAWKIFQQYNDKGFSFTDCTSFAIMERLKITTAFAFDEHFRQYGKFTVVP